ncbi:MAG: CoA-binding protein, partial [Rhodospirillales bacterium]
MSLSSLDPLFKPRAIAVIGASTDPKKIAGRPVHYLKQYFKGPIYPVNPNAEEVQGLKAYAAVADLPEGVDQALVCLPAKLVIPTLEACAARGVRSAGIFSSGFAEIGDSGRDLQNRIREIARTSGMRILGPNCMGVMNIAGIDDGAGGAGGSLGQSITTFTLAVEENPPKAGNIGIVSQSGAFAAHAYTLAARRGLGLSYWATTGNDVDVEFADCLAYLAEDPATDVIMGYMEGCQDGDKLFDAFERARKNEKPMVIVKVGASEVGQKAAASHTAVLSGGDAIFEAVFERYGVHRARTLDEFFDVAYACSFGKFPKSPKIGFASISGGVGILMADKAVELGLDVAPMPEHAAKKLKELLPFAGVNNPVDVTAQIISQPELLQKNIEIMLSEGGYDSIVVFLTTVFYSDVLRRPM